MSYTPRQCQVLRIIRDRAILDGVCPSVQEIADAMGSSWQGVKNNLDALVGRGALDRSAQTGRPRNYWIIDERWSVEQALRDRIAELEGNP